MKKYEPIAEFNFPDRTWPSKRIIQKPVWCSVDLRDGNQALANPMNPQQKMDYFKLLISMGFKEIEISFPSASKADFDFTRTLIEENNIPDDCTIQVLTQAREHLIRKTFEAISGCKRAIVHLYNSTSIAQREIVFRKSPQEIINIAVDGVKLIRDMASKHKGDIILEYSPESFSQTEMNYACDICNVVIETWIPKEKENVIINLPSTVEVTTPNIYADQIEYVSGQLHKRKQIILSVHTHNDRGCATAAAELAQMAGAQRVEGTLFGNGERTGNTDLITLALNLYSQGIDPGIDISNIGYIQKRYEQNTGMNVHARHPYAGDLVFTAFSGSHQDAISKGLAHYKSTNGRWSVPYLPIDPSDIGRSYEAVIRINSQSGKGGIAYIMESSFGFQIPKEMHPVLGAAVQIEADTIGRELTISEVNQCFYREFINYSGQYSIQSIQILPTENDSDSDCDTEKKRSVKISAQIKNQDSFLSIQGKGNGLIDALSNAMNSTGVNFSIVSFYEHSISEGSDAKAVSYIAIKNALSGTFYGAAIDNDTAFASCKALICAINKMLANTAS